jgi:hypothetical protein
MFNILLLFVSNNNNKKKLLLSLKEMGSLFPIQIIPDRIAYYAYFFKFKILEKENLRRFDRKNPITIS